MPKVSSRKRLPKGYVYHDKSSKGGSYRHDIWCAEIYFANVRLRKRSADKQKAQEWLEKTAQTIRTRMQQLAPDASPEQIKSVMEELKRSMCMEKTSTN